MICPLRSYMAENPVEAIDRPCVKEKCQWWVTGPEIALCALQAVAIALDRLNRSDSR